MIARRLRGIARAMAAIANDCEPEDVEIVDYIPEPLRVTIAGWSDALLMAGIHTMFALKRLNEALHGDRDD